MTPLTNTRGQRLATAHVTSRAARGRTSGKESHSHQYLPGPRSRVGAAVSDPLGLCVAEVSAPRRRGAQTPIVRGQEVVPREQRGARTLREYRDGLSRVKSFHERMVHDSPARNFCTDAKRREVRSNAQITRL